MRGLEAAGVIKPSRSDSGWRQFSESDVKAVLRWKALRVGRRVAETAEKMIGIDWSPPRPSVLERRFLRGVVREMDRAVLAHRRETGREPERVLVRWSDVGSHHVLDVEAVGL